MPLRIIYIFWVITTTASEANDFTEKLCFHWLCQLHCQHLHNTSTASWRHQAITNVDLSSVSYSDIHLRTISHDVLQPSITNISLNITFLKSPGGQWVIVFEYHVIISICSFHSPLLLPSSTTGAWASYQIPQIADCAYAGNAGNFFPATDFKGNR